MKLPELFARQARTFSFEFFPPKSDEGLDHLFDTVDRLKSLNPSFVSVTYGAMGSTRRKTIDIVARIRDEIGLEAAAHLTCVGHTKTELEEVLEEIHGRGIENIVALRGDPPRAEAEFKPVEGGLSYACELVRLIRSRYDFGLAVAGYPEGHIECPDKQKDLEHLKLKVDAGADCVITQLFFDNRFYFDFVGRATAVGIRCRIIPGIMPIVNYKQIQRFTQICGASIPADLHRRLCAVEEDPEAVRRIGIEHATQQCRDLLEQGAPGIHFYTLNKSDATIEIFRRLREDRVIT